MQKSSSWWVIKWSQFTYHTSQLFSTRHFRQMLEDSHHATVLNARSFASYAPLLQNPADKLVVLSWDSTDLPICHSSNQALQKQSYTTKSNSNALHRFASSLTDTLTCYCCYLSRMECSDMTGIPQFSLVLTASISPTCTDESICWNICDDDATLGLQGSLSRVLCGLPGYTMVHIFDRGFL